MVSPRISNLHLVTAGRTSRTWSQLGVLLSVVVLAGCGSDSGSGVNTRDAATSMAAPADASTNAVQDARSAKAAPVTAAAQLAYSCADSVACELDALGAKDEAEARWLVEKGYPSAEDLRRFAAMTDAQLKAYADAGSLAAMVAYGERTAGQGDTRTGISYIHDSIERGSLYGYYGMSTVYQTTPGLKNIVDAGAYLRVAYILGDAKAGSELQRRFPGLSQLEQAAIDRRAASLYQTFANGRPPSPRP